MDDDFKFQDIKMEQGSPTKDDEENITKPKQENEYSAISGNSYQNNRAKHLLHTSMEYGHSQSHDHQYHKSLERKQEGKGIVNCSLKIEYEQCGEFQCTDLTEKKPFIKVEPLFSKYVDDTQDVKIEEGATDDCLIEEVKCEENNFQITELMEKKPFIKIEPLFSKCVGDEYAIENSVECKSKVEYDNTKYSKSCVSKELIEPNSIAKVTPINVIRENDVMKVASKDSNYMFDAQNNDLCTESMSPRNSSTSYQNSANVDTRIELKRKHPPNHTFSPGKETKKKSKLECICWKTVLTIHKDKTITRKETFRSNDVCSICNGELTKKNVDIYCQFCDSKFPCSDLLTHATRIDGIISYNCHICYQDFEYQCQLGKHLNQVHGGLTCICGSTFTNLGTLINHLMKMKISQKDKDRNNDKCFICKKVFQYTCESIKHLDEHTQCSFCETVFPKYQDLQSHLEDMTRHGRMTCCFCCQMFDHKCHLVKHIDHVRPEMRKCICGQIFKNPKELINHVIEISKQESIKCPSCHVVFKNQCQMLRHYNETHNDSTTCSLCSQTFRSFNDLVRHSVYTSTRLSDGNKCKICKEIFQYRCEMKKHENTHKLKCSLCDTVFSNYNDCLSHQRIMRGKIHNKCPICKDVFEHLCQLMKHLNETHQNTRTCNLCEKMFDNFTALKTHILRMRLAGNRIDNVNKCNICSQIFQYECEKIKHEETHKKCSFCDTVFASHDDLSFHLKNMTGKDNIKCPICNGEIEHHCQMVNHLNEKHQSSRQCSHCDQTFPSFNGLMQHIMNMRFTDSQKNECSICEERFQYKCEKMKHEETHKKCSFCDTVFSSHDVLVNHLKNMAGTDEKCPVCNEEIEHECQFVKHFNEMHHELRKCSGCDQTFSSVNHLMRHIRSVRFTDSEKDKCGICEERFQYKCEIVNHQKAHPKKCSFCDSVFSSHDDLSSHLKNMNGKGNDKCAICNDEFEHQCQMRKHLNENHQGSRECSLCDQTFLNFNRLMQHIIKMRLTDEEHYQCSICMERFQYKCEFMKHEETHHKKCSFCETGCSYCKEQFQYTYKVIESEKIHAKCSFCYTIFSSPDDLLIHRKIRTGIGNNRCPICNDEFEHQCQIVKHLNEKHQCSRKCSFCDQTFSSFNGLMQHIMNMRFTDSQKEKCGFCEERFQYKCEMIKHEVTHKKCSFCDTVFSRHHDLISHLKNMTGKENKCPVCNEVFEHECQFMKHFNEMHQKSRKCSFCFQTFSSSNHLMLHIIDMRFTDSRKDKCSFCEERFQYKCEKIKHEETHMKCSFCDTVFLSHDVVLSHLKFMTGKVNNKCPICKDIFEHECQMLKHLKDSHSVSTTCSFYE